MPFREAGRASRLGPLTRRVGGLCIAGLLALTSCGPIGGIDHRVGPGENLYRIGKAYGIPYEELARINRLRDPSTIRVGQRIFVPGATRQLPVTIITPERAERATVGASLPPPTGDARFDWPLRTGVLTSRYGPRADTFHDGIDLGAPVGTPVYAARDGRVVYSDRLRGYGNVVILRHEGSWATVYAHNDRNLVREGQVVRRGAMIARVGRSGRATGPNLHFEIRNRNVARDPLGYLPGRPTGRGG